MSVGKPEGERPFEKSVDGKITLILEKWDVRMWTGFVWLRVGFSYWLLQTQSLSFKFHKRQMDFLKS
jgi:hypothetical protein